MDDHGSSDDEKYYFDDDAVDYDDNGYEFQADETELYTTKRRGSLIKVITRESLLAAQWGDLQKIMDLLSLKEQHARTLLIHYSWNVEKVTTVFLEQGKDRLFVQAGVIIVEHIDGFSSSQSPSNSCCNICFDDVSPQDVTAMDCGHWFCNSCWTEHFIVKINEGQSRRIRCMAHKCNAICDEAKIRCLVSARDSGLAKKFDHFLLESYIEDNRRVKWCPSVPHCGNAIRIEADELCEVECPCGLQFCFSCSSEAHSPCSCLMWELWSKNFKDESLSISWITVHTKPCPSCCKPVQKNGGCNMVRCICGGLFNWITGGQYGGGDGLYVKEKFKKPKYEKKNLYRYIHYHKLYKAHTESFKLEYEMKEVIEDKINRLGEKDTSTTDFSWINDGLDRLFRSRRILSYSYPFAFYMFGDELFEKEMTEEKMKINQNFFEDLQEQFEENIEKLSLLFEEKFEAYSDDQIKDFKLRIMTQCVTTENICRNLYEWIENDLLGSLKHSVHKIAPFSSMGVEKASKLLDH